MSALLLPLYLVIFVALIYFVGIRPQQKRKRELEALTRNLRQGDQIITTAGIYGTVTEVEEGGTLLVEVSEDVDIRIAIGAVARLANDPQASAVAPATGGEPATTE
jgi:preprotein translocase subunit YajC